MRLEGALGMLAPRWQGGGGTELGGQVDAARPMRGHVGGGPVGNGDRGKRDGRWPGSGRPGAARRPVGARPWNPRAGTWRRQPGKDRSLAGLKQGLATCWSAAGFDLADQSLAARRGRSPSRRTMSKVRWTCRPWRPVCPARCGSRRVRGSSREARPWCSATGSREGMRWDGRFELSRLSGVRQAPRPVARAHPGDASGEQGRRRPFDRAARVPGEAFSV